jgi:DNA polymerase elongation subunit (family B)
MTTSKKTIGKYFRLIDFQTFDHTDAESSDNDSTDKSKSTKIGEFYIQMYGLNESGDTCSITITDFQPFFYIKVGDDWDQSNASKFLTHIRQKVKYNGDLILSCKIIDYSKLYGFTGGKKSRFCLLTFSNIATFNKVKNLWYEYDSETNQRRSKQMFFENVKLVLYESAIPPLLRYFHIQNMSPSGWVFIQTNKCLHLDKKLTTCKYEYVCSHKYVKAQPEKETPVPYKICSFDIEASSSHGDFPLPKKTYKRLSSNILDIFDKQPKATKENKARVSQLLTKIIMTAFGYDKFNDVDIIYPKKQPSKDEIKHMITMFTSETITLDNIESSEETIEKLFERIKESTNLHAEGEAGGEDEDDSDEEHGDLDVKTQLSKKNKTKHLSVCDVLLQDTYSRDDKIQYINQFFKSANFPSIQGDEVTFIGSTFLKYGEKEPYLNHCLVVGPCDDVEGAVIESVPTEKDLILQWTDLIQKENPDIIIGYNIFGFDYEFMFQRAQENGCASKFLELSRQTGFTPTIYDKLTESEKPTLENTKIKIASGEYDLRFPKMMGRLQIDMYAYFRRDFNLSSYKLDDVAGQFICDSIKKMVISEDKTTTDLYSKNLAGLNVGDFIHIKINGFSSDYYNNGEKFRVLSIEYGVEVKEEYKGKEQINKYNIITISGIVDTDSKSIEWAMSKDDVTPQDIFRLSKGSDADKAIVAKYCIQDCNLVHHLMNKIDVITGYVEMSRICSVPISFLVFRGQGIKLTSYVAKKCREKDTLMPDLDKSGSGDGYEGAIVLPPKCAMYIDNPVACVDYSSLYPSSMISQNYSHDSKVWSKEYDLQGNLIRETGEKDRSGNFIYDNLPGYEYINIEFDTFKYLRPVGKPKSREVKTKVGKKICRWAQLPDNKKSIMPSILEELLDARANTRKKAKSESDPFMQNILDKRQLGYKVTANSLYGQCGARTSTFFEQDVAASTTATGRMMIIYAKRIIEEVYGDRVYDTISHGPVKCRAEYVYGDSVANYTPVTIRVNGVPEIISIDHLAEKYGNNNWVICQEPGKQEKQFCELMNIESWTESGWTKLYRIIRHQLASHKKMIRVKTFQGSEVDVTDDHSLLNPDGIEMSTKTCNIGSELLSCSLDNKRSFEIICSMHEISYEGYVYDLTTENHHFSAGIGSLIVHNTDSVFFTFNLENHETGEKIKGKPALEMTIEIAQDAANLCTSYLKPPMGLAYEKTLMPFLLLSKKRYVGMLYEEDPNKGKLKYMGLVLKRRDNCDLVKDVYGGVLDCLMNHTNIQPAIDFLNNSLNDLIQGNISMDKLAITKSLRSDYKNPQQIAHRVLADRIGQRDPGNKPKPGDRIKYLFIVNKDAKLQGEKIETPEFIIENKLKIDYTYYITNQLMKPLQQLFGLAIEQIWELQNKGSAIKLFKKDVQQMNIDTDGDLEAFMKKREKYTSAKIKTLLFEKCLTKIFNEQNGIRTISDCFKKR